MLLLCYYAHTKYSISCQKYFRIIMNEPPLDPVPVRETGKLLILIKFVVDILTISGNKLCFQFFDINQPSWQIFKEELPELNFIPLTWRGLHCFLLSLSTSPIPRPSHPERESLENVINQKTGIIAALNLWDPSNSSSSLLEKLFKDIFSSPAISVVFKAHVDQS